MLKEMAANVSNIVYDLVGQSFSIPGIGLYHGKANHRQNLFAEFNPVLCQRVGVVASF